MLFYCTIDLNPQQLFQLSSLRISPFGISSMATSAGETDRNLAWTVIQSARKLGVYDVQVKAF
jgi:hypothetical protein